MATGYGTAADWLSLAHKWSGRQVRSDRHHRVEVTEQGLGQRVRCHDCGAIAREEYKKHDARLDADGAIVRSASDPLPWALDRLDSLPCEPLGQLTIRYAKQVR